MMISLQHNNLILRPNLKPKTTSHSQNRLIPAYPNSLISPLSVDNLLRRGHFRPVKILVIRPFQFQDGKPDHELKIAQEILKERASL
jgi:hypothetical protein